VKIILACAAALLTVSACSSDDPARTAGTGDTATEAPASVSASPDAGGSQSDPEAVRTVIDTAVDAANLSDTRMLAAVLCEPNGPQKSDRIPAGAFVNVQGYPPVVEGDEARVDLEIAVPGGETSTGRLVVARKGDGWCLA
jgi:hypothetical protein